MFSKEKILEKFLKNRFTILSDDIDNKKVDTIMEHLTMFVMESRTKPAYLIIDSYGGKVPDSLNLFDFIITLPIPVHAFIPKKCHSASTYPLLACKRRITLPNARFTIHSMVKEFDILSPHPYDLSPEQQMRKALESFKRNREMANKIYGSRLKISIHEFLKKEKEGQATGVSMHAQEALQIGLVTEVCTNPKDWFWGKFK